MEPITMLLLGLGAKALGVGKVAAVGKAVVTGKGLTTASVQVARTVVEASTDSMNAPGPMGANIGPAGSSRREDDDEDLIPFGEGEVDGSAADMPLAPRTIGELAKQASRKG